MPPYSNSESREPNEREHLLEEEDGLAIPITALASGVDERLGTFSCTNTGTLPHITNGGHKWIGQGVRPSSDCRNLDIVPTHLCRFIWPVAVNTPRKVNNDDVYL